ncbi:MAG: hypothetical protein R6V25_08115 [Desulfatiglandales bacterium]
MSVLCGFFGIEIAIGIEIDFLQSIDPGVFLHTAVDIKPFVSSIILFSFDPDPDPDPDFDFDYLNINTSLFFLTAFQE